MQSMQKQKETVFLYRNIVYYPCYKYITGKCEIKSQPKISEMFIAKGDGDSRKDYELVTPVTAQLYTTTMQIIPSSSQNNSPSASPIKRQDPNLQSHFTGDLQHSANQGVQQLQVEMDLIKMQIDPDNING